jgi:aryl-alcohol dehydrogenase-like predicted oxidoreductase/predicted kinase
MGCMRLSTGRDRNEARAIEVLHAAFDAGVTFLDTADAYCWDSSETGHNERLIATALADWTGDRSRITIATKGGLTRPQGGWVADGRARHLVAACEASRRALAVERIPLYQLHALDPRTSLSTSVRALASLQRDGLIDAIGLCNVNVAQIEEARTIAQIAAVQVELSIWQDASVLNGVAEYCLAHDILLLAHRPLGGPQRRRRMLSDRVLSDLAARHGVTPFEIALAWLANLSPLVVPLPGPTRVDTVRSLARARHIVLTDADQALLDEQFPAGRMLRFRERSVERRPRAAAAGEVVLVMGLPGAGKSTLASSYVAKGYARLNRDEAGGALRGLLPALDRLLDSGSTRVVLDNTYVSRRSRATVLATAWKHGVPVRCVWLATSVEDAQVNAAWRLVSRYGRLLTPEDMREMSKRDVAAFGPGVQFRYQRALEPPDPAEGFSAIETVTFERRRDPSYSNRALILWVDGVLRRSRSGGRTPSSPDDVEVLGDRGAVLRRYAADGWPLLGLSWHPEVAEETVRTDQVEATFTRTQELLGVAIDIAYCPHPGGPPICWCRKPLPGLGVVFIHRYRLDAARCIYVGDGPQDPGFARRLGFQYRQADHFFGSQIGTG